MRVSQGAGGGSCAVNSVSSLQVHATLHVRHGCWLSLQERAYMYAGTAHFQHALICSLLISSFPHSCRYGMVNVEPYGGLLQHTW